MTIGPEAPLNSTPKIFELYRAECGAQDQDHNEGGASRPWNAEHRARMVFGNPCQCAGQGEVHHNKDWRRDQEKGQK